MMSLTNNYHYEPKNWIKNWQNNGWKSQNKKPVANKDLWLRLIEVTQNHEISWHWVKGHSINKENNRCDELAVQAREKIKLNSINEKH